MFTFSLEEMEDHTEVQLGGELTIYSAEPLFSSHVKAFSANNKVVVDLEKVDEIDTSGIQILLVLKSICTEQGQTFSLGKLATCVDTYMELFNLREHFDFND